MKYLVYTSVWSLALRRQAPGNEQIVGQLTDFITRSAAGLCGPIRKEVLTGIKNTKQIGFLKNRLHTFVDLEINLVDYELAAAFSNICRAKGIQGSPTDFLLCSLCVNNNLALMTTDRDFLLIKEYIDFNLEFLRLSPAN